MTDNKKKDNWTRGTTIIRSYKNNKSLSDIIRRFNRDAKRMI